MGSRQMGVAYVRFASDIRRTTASCLAGSFLGYAADPALRRRRRRPFNIWSMRWLRSSGTVWSAATTRSSLPASSGRWSTALPG